MCVKFHVKRLTYIQKYLTAFGTFVVVKKMGETKLFFTMFQSGWPVLVAKRFPSKPVTDVSKLTDREITMARIKLFAAWTTVLDNW